MRRAKERRSGTGKPYVTFRGLGGRVKRNTCASPKRQGKNKRGKKIWRDRMMREGGGREVNEGVKREGG